MNGDKTNDLASEFHVPLEFFEEIENMELDLLPPKSRARYMVAYDKFMEWQRSNNCYSFEEVVFHKYMKELAKKQKPSSLWSVYSMLKSVCSAKHKLDISRYSNLILFLKRQSAGYQVKKAVTLTEEEVSTFLNNAPDEIYLATKVSNFFN